MSSQSSRISRKVLSPSSRRAMRRALTFLLIFTYQIMSVVFYLIFPRSIRLSIASPKRRFVGRCSGDDGRDERSSFSSFCCELNRACLNFVWFFEGGIGQGCWSEEVLSMTFLQCLTLSRKRLWDGNQPATLKNLPQAPSTPDSPDKRLIPLRKIKNYRDKYF